jgi:hypothetical protein
VESPRTERRSNTTDGQNVRAKGRSRTRDVGAEKYLLAGEKALTLGRCTARGPGGGPARTTEDCNAADFIKSNGSWVLSAGRGFQTVQAANAYTASTEYRQIKAMRASLRFLKGVREAGTPLIQK